MRTSETNGERELQSAPACIAHCAVQIESNQTSGTRAVALTAASSSCRGTRPAVTLIKRRKATVIQTRCKDCLVTPDSRAACACTLGQRADRCCRAGYSSRGSFLPMQTFCFLLYEASSSSNAKSILRLAFRTTPS